jgi:tyrosyl-tRNA synthetase
LRKLRDFQKLGHTACLIIGDFTATIGDPSGKSKTRPQLTREQVQANVKAVESQLYKILDPAQTEITYNADWLGKMSFADVIQLATRMTVARILERDDFQKRLKEEVKDTTALLSSRMSSLGETTRSSTTWLGEICRDSTGRKHRW